MAGLFDQIQQMQRGPRYFANPGLDGGGGMEPLGIDQGLLDEGMAPFALAGGAVQRTPFGAAPRPLMADAMVGGSVAKPSAAVIPEAKTAPMSMAPIGELPERGGAKGLIGAMFGGITRNIQDQRTRDLDLEIKKRDFAATQERRKQFADMADSMNLTPADRLLFIGNPEKYMDVVKSRQEARGVGAATPSPTAWIRPPTRPRNWSRMAASTAPRRRPATARPARVPRAFRKRTRGDRRGAAEAGRGAQRRPGGAGTGAHWSRRPPSIRRRRWPRHWRCSRSARRLSPGTVRRTPDGQADVL